MDENWTTRTVCTLLELTRKASLRYHMISEHLGNHFDIDYDVFAPDPLLDYAMQLLSEMIKDYALLVWWLTHPETETVYAKDGTLGGCEIETAAQLWAYYQENMGREG